MREQKTIKTLADWELEKGIKIRTDRKYRNTMCSEKKFIRLIENNYIVTKTDKGLEYLTKKGLVR